MKLLRIAFAALAACMAAGTSLVQPAIAKAPLSAFADQPAMRSATLSPDGSRMAYLARLEATLEERKLDWKVPPPLYTRGVLAKYRALAQGAEIASSRLW